MPDDPHQDAAASNGGGGGALRRFYDGLGHLGGLILAVMTGAVFLQVVMRYLGWGAIDGIDEVPRYLFVWLVMIGAAAAMYRSEHTVLDYFLNRLPPRPRALVLALTTTASIVLVAWLNQLSQVLVFLRVPIRHAAGLSIYARKGTLVTTGSRPASPAGRATGH